MNKLPKYFLDGENVLWRAKPRTSRSTFARWTHPKNLKNNIIRAFVLLACYISVMVLLFTPSIISMFQDKADIWIMWQCIISVGFITAIIFSIATPFIINDVWYVVSDQRVIWWLGNTCHYIMFKNLEQVTLRYDGNHDVLEWYGRITHEQNDFYGTEVEKITFVGTEFVDLKDASSLIKLIEQKRGVIIPVEDKRYQAKSKKA